MSSDIKCPIVSPRKGINQKLVDILQTLVKQNPHMRFSQILAAYDFVMRDFEGHWKEEFYVEPDVILERVTKALGR